MPDILKMVAAKFSALPPHSFFVYAAFILSKLFVQLFSINKSLGNDKSVISSVPFSTSPRIITSALLPSISPLVSAIFSDLSSDPISKYDLLKLISIYYKKKMFLGYYLSWELAMMIQELWR